MKWNNSSSYSADDLMAMQKDAMERVREMQRRSDERLRQSNAAIPKPMHPPSMPSHSSAPSSNTQKVSPSPVHANPMPSDSENPSCTGDAGASNGLSGYAGSSPAPSSGKISQALQALGIDQDRMILFAVLLILYNDGADYTLLLAILYLLL